MRKITYKDLYNYINSVKTEEAGIVTLSDKWKLQVYDNKHQVNILKCQDMDDIGLSLVNFVFTESGTFVNIYRVTREGICVYADPAATIHCSESIEDTKDLWVDEILNGKEVHEVLRDLLTPYVTE